MSTVSERSKKRKQAIDTLKDLVSNAEHTLIIHYSCESFYDNKDGKTPRITSIAIRYFKTAQTKSFSIQNVAERKSIEFSRVENEYDMLEKEMLKEFFTFVKSHKAFKWIHWNMRDIYFGFEALENRYTILGGKPTTIEDSNKFDLARILVDIYGLNYAGHPRFESLSDLNGITKRDFMGGSEEAAAFENKNIVLLHRSTLRKVDIMHMITEKTASGILKTKARIKDMYGLSPQGIFELMKDKWLFSVILTAINLLLGGIIGALVSKLF